MVNLCKETNLWRSHGVVVRKEELESEDAAYMTLLDCALDIYIASTNPLRTFVRGLSWAVNRDIEIPKVILMRHCVDTRHPS